MLPAGPLEEQAEVRVQGGHRGRVGEVGQVPGLLAGAARRASTAGACSTGRPGSCRGPPSPPRTTSRTGRSCSRSTSHCRCSRRPRGTGSGMRTSADARSEAAPPGASARPSSTRFDGQAAGGSGSVAARTAPAGTVSSPPAISTATISRNGKRRMVEPLKVGTSSRVLRPVSLPRTSRLWPYQGVCTRATEVAASSGTHDGCYARQR